MEGFKAFILTGFFFVLILNIFKLSLVKILIFIESILIYYTHLLCLCEYKLFELIYEYRYIVVAKELRV